MPMRYWPVLAALLLCACAARAPLDESAGHDAKARPVTVYFVLHAEMDLDDPAIPLTAQGFARASRLAQTFRDPPLSHVLASHTLRARQTLQPVAEEHALPLGVYPALGAEIAGQRIGDASPSTLAIGPVADAIAALAPGSQALFAGNSRNLFAIMHRLGAREAVAADPCRPGEACVPCIEDHCLPPGFDGLWVLIIRDGAAEQLLWLKY